MLRIFAISLIASPALAQPWASTIVEYEPGAGAAFQDAARALGQPARFTGEGSSFPGAVTPFNPPWLGSELVSIGAGGHLVLRFASPVRDDPANPFGLDLLVFGNALYIDTAWPAGIAGPLFAAEATFEASADGADWKPLNPGIVRPTLGFLDSTDPYASPIGAAKSIFTRPVDPAFDPSGLDLAGIIAGYAGSGGGQGFDLAGTGLAEASYFRISVASGAPFQLDALGDVAPIPAPAGPAILLLAARRRRR